MYHRHIVPIALLFLACSEDVFGPRRPDGSDGGGGVDEQCDQDGDGYDSEACSGSDCCDIDDSVPGGDYTATPNACGSFDMDCSSVLEQEWRDLAEDCAVSNACLPDRPPATPGWVTGIPQCGEAGEWSLGCVELVPGSSGQLCDFDTEVRIQRCR